MTLADLSATGTTPASVMLTSILVVATVSHVALTLTSFAGLFRWLAVKQTLAAALSKPTDSMALFSPIVSIGMTLNVILGPVAFLVEPYAGSMFGVLEVVAAIYLALWMLLLSLSVVVGRLWISTPKSASMLNFGSLLDVFAWGMLALAGSTIVGATGNPHITNMVSALTVAGVGIGLAVYSFKGVLLLRTRFAGGALPPDALKPAYFIIVPINCLFAVALFKLTKATGAYSGVTSIVSWVFLALFSAATLWAGVSAVTLKGWFQTKLLAGEFYPSQWGLVCLFVGLEVLALYTNSFIAPWEPFVFFAYASTVLATLIFGLVLSKYLGWIAPAEVAAVQSGRSS